MLQLLCFKTIKVNSISICAFVSCIYESLCAAALTLLTEQLNTLSSLLSNTLSHAIFYTVDYFEFFTRSSPNWARNHEKTYFFYYLCLLVI